MRNLYKFLSLIVIVALGASCTNDNDKIGLGGIDATETQVQTKSFAEDDGATDLSKRTNGMKAYKLLSAAGTEIGNSLGILNITDSQYAEIKTFTDNLVAGCTSDEEIHKNVFNWIVANVKYDWSDNEPYTVFTEKKGICQGYSNLLKVMLHSQGVPCVQTNGWIETGYGPAGHAWAYVYFNDTWYVSDPTNNYYYLATAYTSHSNDPISFDAILFEDEYCTYQYNEGHLNVRSIKEGHESVSIPYSAGGFVVTMLSPTEEIPSTVKELYVGANIKSFGEEIIGITTKSKSIENIHIDPNNANFEAFSTGVYKKNQSGDNLLLVAPGARYLELKPIEAFDKECKIKNLPNLESITFVPGTKSIGAWSVENCPQLHTAYIPQETEVNSAAFDGVAKNFKIVRGNFTNIPQIRL